jgi:hypothetical protein
MCGGLERRSRERDWCKVLGVHTMVEEFFGEVELHGGGGFWLHVGMGMEGVGKDRA